MAEWSKEFGFYAEWSVDEKVALEVAAGAAYAGARCLVAMKQVGLNERAFEMGSEALVDSEQFTVYS